LELPSGARYEFEKPDPDVVNIYDIAYALAFINRALGRFGPYSVAQHSVLGSRRIAPPFRFPFLMHDAAEAFIGDWPTPLKLILPKVQDLEALAQTAIATAFDLSVAELNSKEVKFVDARMLATEKRDLVPSARYTEWIGEGDPYPDKITCWTPGRACSEFLDEFDRLSQAHASGGLEYSDED
jgi:hypothetical protein